MKRDLMHGVGYLAIGVVLGCVLAAHSATAASPAVMRNLAASPCGSHRTTHAGNKVPFAVDRSTGMSVQASHLHVDTHTSTFNQPKKGYEFMVVHVLFHNGGTKPHDYNPVTLSLHGSVDQQNYAGDALDTNITPMGSGALASGQFIAGDVAFEVPLTRQTYTLLWDADYGLTPPIPVPLNP